MRRFNGDDMGVVPEDGSFNGEEVGVVLEDASPNSKLLLLKTGLGLYGQGVLLGLDGGSGPLTRAFAAEEGRRVEGCGCGVWGVRMRWEGVGSRYDILGIWGCTGGGLGDGMRKAAGFGCWVLLSAGGVPSGKELDAGWTLGGCGYFRRPSSVELQSHGVRRR